MGGCPKLGRRDLVRAGIGAGAALGAIGDAGSRAAAQEATPDPAAPATLPLDDLQPAVLQPRPVDYVAAYVAVRIDDAALARGYLRQALAAIPSVAEFGPTLDRPAIALSFTWEGLRALGVPRETLESFPAEFREGMAARAALLGDVGPSAPERWVEPFADGEVHLLAVAFAADRDGLEREFAAIADGGPGVAVLWRLDLEDLPTGRTQLGYTDNISQPAIEGSGTPPLPGQGEPIRAGEFFLGHVNEDGVVARMPQPDAFSRNGTFGVFRMLHTDVAAFRRFLREQADGPGGEELVAAKIVGRWPSGAPLTLCPDADDPELAADPLRNNDFRYLPDDARGFRCPAGSHIRRTNPRDSPIDGSAEVRRHRVLRRGAVYGPMLPEGALEDDGAERGIAFLMLGASIARQYEFVKQAWIQDGTFIGLPGEMDPLSGQSPLPQEFTIPAKPVRRRLKGLPQFVSTRAGCYVFVPSLTGLRWLADLEP